MLPSHTDLTYFLELAQTLNFSRAAERLGITQPSLSMAIRRLENNVGTSLFSRHKQGVALTQAGKQLASHTRQLLEFWENTKSEAIASEKEVQGSFTIGCNSTIAIHMVPHFLPTLLETYPKLDFHFIHDISRKMTEQVIHGSVDFGIVVNPIKHPDLIIRHLCDDQVTFWVGPGTRNIQSSHHAQAVILCEPQLTQTQTLLKKCDKAGISTQRILTIPSLSVIASLTAAGCGIGILPTRVARTLCPGVLHPLDNAPVYSDKICLIYRNEIRKIAAARTIIDSIKDSFLG